MMEGVEIKKEHFEPLIIPLDHQKNSTKEERKQEIRQGILEIAKIAVKNQPLF